MLLDDHLILPNFMGKTGESPPFLPVDEKSWRRQLDWSERWENALGCGVFVVLLVLGIIFLHAVKIGLVLMALLMVVSLIWKYRIIKKYAYLIEHGTLSFVVHQDRIVRYTLTNYQVFFLKDIHHTRIRPYGIELHKESSWLRRFNVKRYHYQHPTLLVIPKATAHYPAIEAHLAV